MSNVVLLIGPPGVGKSRMVALTAPARPVHFFDIDRKLSTMAWARFGIENGDITYDELKSPLVENTLESRARELAVRTLKPREPMGWMEFSQMLDNIEKNTAALNAKSWCVDSWTLLSAHLERVIGFHAGKIAFTFTEWGALLKMSQDAVTIVIDFAKHHGKDLYITVHEKEYEQPLVDTKVIRNAEGVRQFLGPVELMIGASVAGQFGAQMPMHFTEVYALRVENKAGKEPEYICRVMPDGKRPLRTSYNVEKAEWPCDFRLIWGVK